MIAVFFSRFWERDVLGYGKSDSPGLQITKCHFAIPRVSLLFVKKGLPPPQEAEKGSPDKNNCY